MAKTIEIAIERTVGDVINTTISFMKINAKTVFAAVFIWAIPFFAIGSIFSSLHTYYFNQDFIYDTTWYTPYKYWKFIVGFLCTNAGVGQTIACIAVVFRLYNQNKKAPSLKDFHQYFTKNLRNIFGNVVLYLVVVTFCYAILVGLAFLINESHIGGLYVFYMFVLYICLGFFYFVLKYQFISSCFYAIRDNTGYFDGHYKTRRYLKENFWKTWFLIALTYGLTSILSQPFEIPKYILEYVLQSLRLMRSIDVTEGNLDFEMLYTIGADLIKQCGMALVFVLFYVGAAFHSYSLEERFEANTLMEKINSILPKQN